MSIYKKIEAALTAINQARFQDLINHLLHVRGYQFIGAPGSTVGKEKTSKGAPDSFFLHDDKYVFVECTTQERLGKSKSFFEKLGKDIDHCFDEKKTKVPASKIELVILACNEKLHPDEHNSLRERVAEFNPQAKLELYSIQNLPMAIYDFPGLSEQYVGVEIIKGEIYNLPDFLIKTTKGLQPSLTNEFVGRQDELKAAVEYLAAGDIVLLSGPAGVGKSKLAISILKELESQSFIPIVIQSSTVPLWDDFVNLFQNGKNYIILFDDANKSVQNLAYLLDFIQKPKLNRLKVVITTRDYVKQQVLAKLDNSRYKEIEVGIFKDEVINEITVKALPNLKYYPDIQKRIGDLSKGNARVALMATYSVVPDAAINYLSSPVELYEKYFGKIAQELSIFTQPIMLQALAIVSFFGVLDKHNERLIEDLTLHFDVDWDEIWDAILLLHKHEVLDVHEDEVVKVADQVLGTYAFYKCFIDPGSAVIDYGKWISIFISKYDHRIRTTLIDINNTFHYTHIKELTLPHLNNVLATQTDDDSFYAFYSLFWFYKGYETLNYLRKWITQLPIEEKPSHLEFSYVHNNHTKPTKYFELLVNFWNHPNELLKPALNLALDLMDKQPSRIPESLKFINEHFTYSVPDLDNGYLRQNILLDVLLNEGLPHEKRHIAEGLFLNVVEKLLGWHFTDFGSSKGRSFTIINFDLYKSPELIKLRSRILEGFFASFEKNEQQTHKILEKIVRPGGKIDKQMYAEELPLYEKIVSKKCDANKYAHCKFVRKLSKHLSEIGITHPDDWNRLINSEILQLSTFLKIDWFDEKRKGIAEREEERKKEFANFISAKTWDEIKLFLFSVADLYRQQPDYSKWAIDAAITDIFIAIARKGKTEADLALRMFFDGSLNIPIQARVVHFIINEKLLSGKEFISIMNDYEFANKPFWTITLLNILPKDQINGQFLELLIDTVAHSSAPLPIYRLREFEKFEEVFADYKQKHSNPVKPEHNIITFLTEILLSKTASHRISLGFEFCEECASFFERHIPLFKQAFIYLKENEEHFDYEGKALRAVLDLDKNFFTEYLSSEAVNFDYLTFRFEYFQLDYIWSLEDAASIIEKSIDIIISKVPFFSNFDHPAAHLFSFRNPTEQLTAKALAFIENFINKHFANKEYMCVIMNVVLHRFLGEFIRFLKQFFILNKDVAFLKSIYLDQGGVYSGSRIPHIQREIDFCKEVIEMIRTLPDVLDYGNHIQYLEQKIMWLNKDKAREQKMEFREEYY